MHVDAGVVVAACAVVSAATITATATLIVGWLNHRDLRKTRTQVAEIHDRTDTRNGATIGEAVDELYKRARLLEQRLEEFGDNELDLLDGMAWLGGELVRMEGRLRRRAREEQSP